MAKKISLGSLEGRKERIHGLMLAAKQMQAEEQIKAKQLELFEKMETMDAKKIQ